MSITVRRALVAVGAAGAMVAGLGVAALVGSSAAGASTAPGPITYRVGSTGKIQGPGHVAPGQRAFKLMGFASQQFQLVKPYHRNYTKAMLVAEANEAIGQGNPRPLESHFSLVGGASPHSTLYVKLERATYYAFDPNVKLSASKIRTIVVKNGRKGTHFPSASTIIAKGMHAWGSSPSSIPAHGVLRFSNKSSDWHFIEIDRLKNGKTFADVKKVLMGKEPFGKVFTSGGRHNNFSMGVVSPGRGEAASYTLNKGNYAVLCFFPDHRTGTPHAFEGMARGIKVG